MSDALTTADRLASLLADDPGEVTVLDVRWALGRSDGHHQFLAGHVPGAAYVDLETDLADPPGDGSQGRHPLPAPERFAAAMRRCGVRRSAPVVVYDAVGGSSATRAWWLLRDHGHPDVRVLDGGWPWWVEGGHPVETGDRVAVPGDLPADPGHLRLLDEHAAAALARDGVLLDARAPERYRGESEPVDPVAGHVPGARNVPFAANLQPAGHHRAGRFLDSDALREVYAAVGVTGSSPVGAYCGSGITATHDVFALHLLGIEAALYAGSWSAWVSDPARPVATGP